MNHYRNLSIGGGLTDEAAVRGIRELNAEGSIGRISMDPDPPYTRPHLSTALWKGRLLEKIWRNNESLGADLYLGRKLTQLELPKKYLRDDTGEEYTYDKLLLATGALPIRLPFGD